MLWARGLTVVEILPSHSLYFGDNYSTRDKCSAGEIKVIGF